MLYAAWKKRKTSTGSRSKTPGGTKFHYACRRCRFSLTKMALGIPGLTFNKGGPRRADAKGVRNKVHPHVYGHSGDRSKRARADAKYLRAETAAGCSTCTKTCRARLSHELLGNKFIFSETLNTFPSFNKQLRYAHECVLHACACINTRENLQPQKKRNRAGVQFQCPIQTN